MNLIFFGDSITDASRNQEPVEDVSQYGCGYVAQIAGQLSLKNPERYTVLNRGISGDRVTSLLTRVKRDVWRFRPDVLTVLVGVNDVWHELSHNNGVDIELYEQIYDILLTQTEKKFPQTKIILMEPFLLHGSATDGDFTFLSQVLEYAKVVKRLAEKHNAYFLPLQEKLEKAAALHGAKRYLVDGVHPNIAGAALIANEWIKLFEKTEAEI